MSVIEACRAADVRYSITAKLFADLKQVIEAIDESAWTPIAYFCDGAAVAETTYRSFGPKGEACRLIVRRVRPTPGSQLALFSEFSYHAFITDRPGATLELEADHRRHAEIENVIRDLKYGVGLNHLPSGRFGANAAWLGLGVIAHNLARFSTRLELDGETITTETFRRRYLSLPGRLTRSAPTRHRAPAGTLALGRAVPRRPHRSAHHGVRDLNVPLDVARAPRGRQCNRRSQEPLDQRVFEHVVASRWRSATPGGYTSWSEAITPGSIGEVGRWFGHSVSRRQAQAQGFLAHLGRDRGHLPSGPRSNRACRSPAHGSPTSFVTAHAQSGSAPFQ